MFEHLAVHSKIVVTGPQRSGHADRQPNDRLGHRS